jgi:hypothetical protein
MKSKIKEIKNVYNGLQTLYDTYLPKVDSALIDDLLMRQQKNPKTTPIYMVEAFAKQGTDSEAKRNHIYEMTGVLPAIYDNGTHYAANHRLTLEMLKEISNDNDIVEITGEYTGSIGGWGASHEYRRLAYLENYSSVSSSAALLLQKQVQKKQEKEQIQYEKTEDQLREIRIAYRGLQTLYQTYFPNVDAVLIHDLLMREKNNSNVAAPFYMVEMFTKAGMDSVIMKGMIFEKTGMVPAIYDRGTHYVTNHRLSLEMLHEISDLDYVVEITGEYTGEITGRGVSHEHRDMNDYF